MSETGQQQPAAASYADWAELGFAKAEIAVKEGAIVAEGMFDHAYAFVRGELVKLGEEIDSNALFFALTAEQQKRGREQPAA